MKKNEEVKQTIQYSHDLRQIEPRFDDGSEMWIKAGTAGVANRGMKG
jgi:hypothetical protein|tara:strand:+ start:612 stop:752 length:141 start_codon:yes stop_codon:yes gene_type:complete